MNNTEALKVARTALEKIATSSDWYPQYTSEEALRVLDALVTIAPPVVAQHAPTYLESYDAGLLSDFGGGNVEWWQDYLRAELSRADDFYQSQVATLAGRAVTAEKAGGLSDEQVDAIWAEVLMREPLPQPAYRALAHAAIAAARPTAADGGCLSDDAIYSYRRKLADGTFTNWTDCDKAQADHVMHPDFREGFEVRMLYAGPPAMGAVDLNAAQAMGEPQHDSDCSTNNRGVPDLLGPCDCSVAMSQYLPPLPKPTVCDCEPISAPTAYTADQMHDYARAAIAAIAATGKAAVPIAGDQLPKLVEGEHYAGILLGEDGTPQHHLILLGEEMMSATWDQAVKWANDLGGELPTRREQSLLLANLKDKLATDWYWSSEQYAPDPGLAWNQNFSNGNQNNNHKTAEGRARAVRRVTI